MLPGHWFTFGKNSAYDDGVRAMRSGDYASSITHFQKACRESNDPSIVKLAATFIVQSCRKHAAYQITQGDGMSASSTIAIALGIRSNFADLHFLHARAWFLEGDVEKIQSALDNAIALNANYTVATQLRDIMADDSVAGIDAEVISFIRSEFSAENRIVALTAFDKATFTSEVDIRAKIGAAQVYADKKQFQRAADTWQEILDERPNYPDVRCQFGQALLELNRVEEALAQFEQVIAINPKMADAHALLGISQKRLGLTKEAASSFEAARKLNPHHPIADMETTRR